MSNYVKTPRGGKHRPRYSTDGFSYTVSNSKDPMVHNASYGACSVEKGCSYNQKMISDDVWMTAPNAWSERR